MQYDARLKYQMDEAARLEQALLEDETRGEAKGLQKGQFLGRIRLLQEMLGIDVLSDDEFSLCNESQPSDLANQLQNQLRNRRS